MDNLFEVIKSSLRRGDVFSRFSATQYVLMLPTLTYENCEMVMERVIRRYRQTFRAKAAEIIASVQPLSPVELQEHAMQ
jgi:GGDEF domain-containing protein